MTEERLQAWIDRQAMEIAALTAKLAVAEGKLQEYVDATFEAGVIAGQAHVRISELESRLAGCHNRAAHWQDVARGLERQVELLRQAMS